MSMAIIGTTSAVIGGYASYKGAKEQSKAAQQASDASIAEQQRQFDLIRQDQAPYRQIGRGSLGLLSQIFGVPTSGRTFDNDTGAEVSRSIPTPVDLGTDRMEGGPYAGRRTISDSMYEPDPRIQARPEGAFGGAAVPNDPPTSPYGAVSRVIPPSPDTSAPAERTQSAVPQVGEIPDIYAMPDAEIPEWSFDPSTIDPTQEVGYQFRQEQGQNALENMLSKQGRSMGGSALKEAMRYNQGFASNEFSNAYNRMFQGALTDRSMAVEDYQRQYGERQNAIAQLFQLAGFGPAANATTAQAGMGMASNVANILGQNAQAQGNAAMTRYSGLNNAIQGGMENYMTWNLLNRNPGGGGGGTQINPYNTMSASMDYDYPTA